MSDSVGFQQSQYTMTRYLRNPDVEAPPAAIEQRRLNIYKDLIYNNIENFLKGGFPVLRSLYSDEDWHRLVRAFVIRHQSHSPFFLEISQEFLEFLQTELPEGEEHPPFMLELAHYEWVELALDVEEDDIPVEFKPVERVLSAIPVVSPVAWSLAYQYPVHRIGQRFQPSEPGEQPTYLVVYRNRHDEVKFMESNAVTARLLELLTGLEKQSQQQSLEQVLVQLGEEIQHPDKSQLFDFGSDLVEQLHTLGVISHYQ